MRKFLYIFLIIALTAVAAPPRKRTSASVRNRQQQTERQIRRTERDLQRNQEQVEANLNALNALNADVARQAAVIKAMNDSIEATERTIKTVTDSIDTLEHHVARMRDVYSHALRTARTHRLDVDNYALIFSAGDISTSLKRYRYLQIFARWLAERGQDLRDAVSALHEKKDRLHNIKAAQRQAMERLTAARDLLLAQQSATQVLVNQLTADRRTLSDLLRKKREEARRLDEELNRIIEEEARRAAEEEEARRRAEAERARQAQQQQQQQQASGKDNKDKKDGKKEPERPRPAAQPASPKPAEPPSLTGGFESNRGKLPSPVDGKYKIVKPFGVTNILAARRAGGEFRSGYGGAEGSTRPRRVRRRSDRSVPSVGLSERSGGAPRQVSHRLRQS